MLRLKGLVLTSVMLLFWGIWVGQGLPVEPKSAYVGSETCATCHAKEFALWKTSLHSRMYQKAEGAILGDFTSNEPLRSFRKEDVAYTIGSRWEQMYVTRRNNEEYLLPAKWLIAQKKWAPLDATHQRNGPISKACHGCHTTAWNPEAGRFAEMNIGCEACHSSEYHMAKDRRQIDTAGLRYGVTCIACHNPHGRVAEDKTERAAKADNASCLACHFTPGLKSHLTQAHHYPCPQNAARCIDCHMPVTGLSASTFNIRSHTMRIITPEAAQPLGMPSSCNNASCHSDKDFGWLKRAYTAYYQGKSFVRAN